MDSQNHPGTGEIRCDGDCRGRAKLHTQDCPHWPKLGGICDPGSVPVTPGDEAAHFRTLLRNPHYYFGLSEQQKLADLLDRLVAALADTRQALERIADGTETYSYAQLAAIAREALAGCRERTRQQDEHDMVDGPLGHPEASS